ncbi:hypothetical protein Pelo_17895 [Pelomyxa schiedti]|nr:hypothetical protein Pelo_17895 [Pelomyxa schiedti]
MASHNRCGASSPARHLVRALLATSSSPLWDWCLGPDSEVVLSIFLEVPRFARLCYFTVGISCALMGVTREFKLHACWPYHTRVTVPVPLGPYKVVLTEQERRYSLVNAVTLEKKLLLIRRFRDSSEHCGNEKWWLHYDDQSMLTIASTMDECSSMVEVAVEREGASVYCYALSLSMRIPDEAVLVLYDCGRQVLRVIDVEKSYTTKKLVVLSCTTCRGCEGEIAACVLMKKSTGQRALFVHLVISTHSADLCEVLETTGTMTPIAHGIESVSQLSSSLFSTTRLGGGPIDIWDCNNLTLPLRVIERSPGFSGLAASPVFIFQKLNNKGATHVADDEDDGRVEVVSTSTGINVGVIHHHHGFIWYIVADADSPEGNRLSPEDFVTAKNSADFNMLMPLQLLLLQEWQQIDNAQ